MMFQLSPDRWRQIDNYLASGAAGKSRDVRQMLAETMRALEELEMWAAEARVAVTRTLYIAQLLQLEQVAKTCQALLHDHL